MLPDWETLLATLDRVRESVAAQWQESIAWTPSPTSP
jgi:[glutamine synthetase] adenylyltransferase / [glutamine synthetase]-adenylyl-L-tyrosine phosphorylase